MGRNGKLSLLVYDRIITAYGKDLHNRHPEYSAGIYRYFLIYILVLSKGAEEKLMDNIQYKARYMERTDE